MALTKDLPDSPEDIIQYLRHHPDFFVEHTDLLTELNIPHDTPGKLAAYGDVASLIEHQVALLREQNSGLSEDLERSEEDISQQRKLANSIHDLSLRIMKIESLKTLSDLLGKELKQHYQTEQFIFFVFRTPVYSDNYPNIRFLEANSKLSFMFSGLFRHNKPLCDSLQTEHIDALFGSASGNILSTALIPVHQSGWQGLLAVGSKKMNQYSHGFKLDLLNYLTMISATVIENIVSNNSSTTQQGRH